MSSRRVNFRDSPEGGSRSSRYTSDSGVGSLSDNGSRSPDSGFTAREADKQWTNLPALQDAYRTLYEANRELKKKARELDEDAQTSRKNLKEVEAKWRAIVDRNEQLEDEKKKLFKERKQLADENEKLLSQNEKLKVELADAIMERREEEKRPRSQRGSPPTSSTGANSDSKPKRQPSKRESAKDEKTRLGKRFETKDPDGKSDSTSSSRPPRARRGSYIEPFGPGPNSRSTVPPSPTSGAAVYSRYSESQHYPASYTRTTEPAYSGVPRTVRPAVVMDNPYEFDDPRSPPLQPPYQESGSYYPHPLATEHTASHRSKNSR